MRTASAITLSIIIMMIVLAALLGYTAFYVDQVTLRPVILMHDSETSLKCFFVLSNIVGGDYLRDGEAVPQGSLREKLLDFYGVTSGGTIDFGSNEEFFNQILLQQYGKSQAVIAEEEIFWDTVNINNLPLACYMQVYGPLRVGVAGMFTDLKQGVDVRNLMHSRQCQIAPAYAIGGCS